MRITDVLALARDNCGANENSFSNAKAVLYLKAIVPTFQADIEGVDEQYMGSIEYRDLRATGDGTYVDTGVTYLSREYNLPTDMIPRLAKVHAKLDGTNFMPMKRYSFQNIEVPLEEDLIQQEYPSIVNKAGFTIFRGSLFILSGEIETTIVNGLKIWTYAFSSEISTIPAVGSDDDVDLQVFGIPETLHGLLATALSLKWRGNHPTPLPLTPEEQNYYALYGKALAGLKGLDRGKEIIPAQPLDRYNNGFNC